MFFLFPLWISQVLPEPHLLVQIDGSYAANPTKALKHRIPIPRGFFSTGRRAYNDTALTIPGLVADNDNFSFQLNYYLFTYSQPTTPHPRV